ncbi:hypothetical protein MMC12_003116 [Toensbergia leucococca]|nr:hypothetical protein [Toensbergia leucococca]
MAVSFLANSWQLANWGFSAGDIAALAGAGRNVITWLSASGRDKILFEFLKITPGDLGIRRGLINPVALNQRWGKKIVLFQNGQRCELRPAGRTAEIENIDAFTWIMTIIVVCLDQVVSNTMLQIIVGEFITRLFEDSTLDLEYLQHEIPTHIQGWRSTACVRDMVAKAQHTWKALEYQQQHLPGFAPPDEKEEIIQMLLWIVIGKSARYSTASTDVFSLTILLGEMGFDLLKTGLPSDRFDESYAVAVFDDSTIRKPAGEIKSCGNRHGMRIPLLSMEESISLWPGTLDNNRRRNIFLNGMEAGSNILISAYLAEPNQNRGPDFKVTAASNQSFGRGDSNAFRLAQQYLLLSTREAVNGLQNLIESWAIHSAKERERVVRYLEGRALLETDMEYLADLQIFLLGYYYASFVPIVNTSQLPSQEAFGSWSWYDLEFMDLIAKFVNSCYSRTNTAKCVRWYEVMKVVAYLFAGGEKDQLDALTFGTVGLLSKLTILNASLLGDVDTPDRVGKFVLLDIDPTGIPSNSRGLVLPGKQAGCRAQTAISPAVSKIQHLGSEELDFTSHIQPAWGFDPNHVLVTYRHKGRLVHKMNPRQMEISVLKWSTKSEIGEDSDVLGNVVELNDKILLKELPRNSKPARLAGPSKDARPEERVRPNLATESRHPGSNSVMAKTSRFGGIFTDPYAGVDAFQLFQVTLPEFYGGNIVMARQAGGSSATGQNALIFPVKGLKRARACIVSMYKDHTIEDNLAGMYGPGWEAWGQSFPGALVCEMPGNWHVVLP